MNTSDLLAVGSLGWQHVIRRNRRCTPVLRVLFLLNISLKILSIISLNLETAQCLHLVGLGNSLPCSRPFTVTQGYYIKPYVNICNEKNLILCNKSQFSH